MNEKRFNPKKLHKLNNPKRLLDLPPEYIWSKLNMNAANVIMDIGAGTGFFSIPFANYTKELFACDISDIMIEWMTKNICPKYPNIIPLNMETNSVPLQDKISDLVYMINLHHELDEPDKMLKECRRLLKDNAMIFIADWKKEEMAEGPPMHLRCLPVEVKKQLLSVGFRNIALYDEMEKHFLIVAEK